MNSDALFKETSSVTCLVHIQLVNCEPLLELLTAENVIKMLISTDEPLKRFE